MLLPDAFLILRAPPPVIDAINTELPPDTTYVGRKLVVTVPISAVAPSAKLLGGVTTICSDITLPHTIR